MLVLLVGPKGSGKSHVGRVLERRLGVHFFHVEPLWMAYHADCRAAGREPDVAGGMRAVHPKIAQALATHARVCVETTGAAPEILAGLRSLAPPSATRIVRVRAPLDLCLRRVAGRDQTHQIPMDMAGVRQVHALSDALDLDAAVVLENTALSDDEIVAAVERALAAVHRPARVPTDGRRSMAEFRITTHDGHPPQETALVDSGLGAANAAAAPLHEVQPVSCFARTPAGEVIGGAVGRRWGHCCELQQLWVDPAHRRRGIATQLVGAFERDARRRGCSLFYLETFSFQAPALYRSLGYRVAHEHAVYPHGIVRFLMVKRFADDDNDDPDPGRCEDP